MNTRLTTLNSVSGQAQLPKYIPGQHQVGIAHIGVGAFHRAHQAVMTDDALATHGGDWRIAGVSLRSKTIATKLNAQNGLYTVLEQGEATKARVIGSIDHVVANDAQATLELLCMPQVKIVTLTVTEAGYGIDLHSRQPDNANAIVAADLAQLSQPAGVLGLLVAALTKRRKAGDGAFTVLCCDNLPENGLLVRDGLIGFARQAYDDELAQWIETNIAFPCSMVDRITPASTCKTYSKAAEIIGCEDQCAVETEPFTQWIIEDNFPSGRPQWEAGGAIFVDDVKPYERMKLTMLNGSHSMLAYSGFLTGKKYVKDVMQDEHLSSLVNRHFEAAASLLAPLPNFNYKEYASQLSDRFRNPAIEHQTFQIASDGTQKLPQRIFQPAIDALNTGVDVRPFAFATAMWMRFILQQTDEGAGYELHDPRSTEIAKAIEESKRHAWSLSDAFHSMPDFIPQQLCGDRAWREATEQVLNVALNEGCIAAVKHEALDRGLAA